MFCKINNMSVYTSDIYDISEFLRLNIKQYYADNRNNTDIIFPDDDISQEVIDFLRINLSYSEKLYNTLVLSFYSEFFGKQTFNTRNNYYIDKLFKIFPAFKDDEIHPKPYIKFETT